MIKIFKVGGAVRDQLMGLKPKDIDYAVEADSYEEMRAYIAERGKIFLETPQYFTIRATIDNKPADYVLCRKESDYTDGRRPDKVEVGTILDDLSRRDFTVNAIAEREDGTLYDPFDGLTDLNYMVLRCVGSPYERFHEDSLRMLRALRFKITKGFKFHCSIDKCLYDLDLVNKLSNVSEERIREEMNRCFQFDTLRTLDCLYIYFELKNKIFERNLWIQTTLKSKG